MDGLRLSGAGLGLLLSTAAMGQVVMLDAPFGGGNSNFGSFSVSAVSSVDKGFPGVLVGAHNTDRGPDELHNSGAAHLFSARTGELLRTFISPMPVFYGAFGRSVAGIEDLDGDGAGDVLIGAYLEGRVYVFSGGTGDLIRVLTYSTPGGGYFGMSVSAAPDLDQDGTDDIVVGSSGESGERGMVYIFSGATGAQIHTVVSPNPRSGGQFGDRVAGVPDADGDGAGDILVGAYNEGESMFGRDRGRAYLCSGATGKLLHAIESPVTPPEYFGEQVMGSPDLNGDGMGDFLISGRQQEAPGSVRYAGLVHAFSGATGALLYTLAAPVPQTGGFFGSGIGVVPDLDADGRPEILVGAGGEEIGPGFDINTNHGGAYLFSGATGRLLRSMRSPTPQIDGAFGVTVAAIPDFNNDGRGDFCVGSNDCPGTCLPQERGRIYVYPSCAADFNADAVLDSRDVFHFLSGFFAGSADFNADAATDSQDFFDFLSAFFAGC